MAVSVVDRVERGRSRADLTMEDALLGIPGLFIANRYKPSWRTGPTVPAVSTTSWTPSAR